MLIGIDASRAVSDAPTGTETYSREMIRALLQIDCENQYRLYTRQRVAREYFFVPPVIASTFASLSVNSAKQSSGDAEIASPHPSTRSAGSDSLLAVTNPQYNVSALPFPRMWTHTRLSLEMLTRAPDLLWIPAHVLPLAHPRCAIVTIHDLGNWYFPEAYPVLQRAYHRWSQEWNARAASHIFVDSQATQRDLEKFFKIAPEKITVVYPAYDSQLYRPVEDGAVIEKVKARFRVEGDYVIALGTIHPRKNYARLIQAIQKLRETRFEHLRLVIVGKRGWLFDSFVRETPSLKFPVSFLDYVAQDDMPALLSGARLFVFPSLHEGFGLPILEAQACGVPVACSNTSSLSEAAGEGAIFFDPCNVDAMVAAIQEGLTDESLRASLIARGFDNVKRFGWERSARVALDVMNGIGRNG